MSLGKSPPTFRRGLVGKDFRGDCEGNLRAETPQLVSAQEGGAVTKSPYALLNTQSSITCHSTLHKHILHFAHVNYLFYSNPGSRIVRIMIDDTQTSTCIDDCCLQTLLSHVVP